MTIFYVYHTDLDKFNTRGKCWKFILKKLMEGTADGVIDHKVQELILILSKNTNLACKL